VTLNDTIQLAFLLKNAEPAAYEGQAAHASWASVCGQLAAGIRKHKLVSDHPYDEEMFLLAATDQGEYLIGDEA
jgi:hypothetical protein